MSTSTTRLGLVKPATTESYDVTIVNANADKVDNGVGSLVVTSTTRPSAPFSGQTIFETDTGNTLTWNGTAWSHRSMPVVTATSQILAPYEGQVIHNTTDGMLYRRTSGAWVAFAATGTVRHEAAYKQSVAQTGLASGSDTKITWDANDYTTSDVTYSAGTFTIARAGLWQIHAVLRLSFNASGNRNLILATGASTATRFDNITTPGNISSTGSLSSTRRFAVNDTVAVWVWQDSGTALTTDVSFAGNRIELAWLRP